MKCIIGLGNPGVKYALTRHNIGFMVIDIFAQKYEIPFYPSKYDYYYSESKIGTSGYILLKPTTYMNLSGCAVLDLLDETMINIENILVVVDDINLPLGKIRIRKSGSDGGHNGIKSIIYHLNNDKFPRIRFGIGDDFKKGGMINFVLNKFELEENEMVNNGIEFSINLIEKFIIGGYKSMADYYSANAEMKNKQIDEGNDF